MIWALMSPSSTSFAVPTRLIESPSVKVAPFVGEVMVTVGVKFDGSSYSMWISGALDGDPLNDYAARSPVPSISNTNGAPEAQPGRSTISWTTADRSGVR